MRYPSIFKRTLLNAVILSAVASPAMAEDDIGFIKALEDYTGLETGMWASAGVTYASHNRDDHNNAPMGFNDRNSQFALNQLNFYLERGVNTEGNAWDFGGRMDFMYGVDARQTKASGWDDEWGNGGYYDIAMPQLYAEIYAPIGNGITAKIGHFYTSIGYEVVTSPDNFFYSHAYTMYYAEPFTHNGVTFSYDLNDNISINAGAVMGWDNMSQDGEDWNFLGGASWSSDDGASSVTVQLITGDRADTGNTTMYSLVATHDFSSQLHYVFQHDYGVQKAGPKGDWFGVNQYLTYDVTDQVAVGLRAEWFYDKSGAQRVNAIGANYLAASIGVNYSPLSWFTVRPEVRFDWADEKVFNSDTEDGQISLAMDMIVSF